MRIVVCLLTVLLILTPTTQVLAQAEQQEQEPQATQGEGRDDEQEAALTSARVAEPDTVQLLRLGAMSLFPNTDSSPAAYDSAAATPATAALSTPATVVIVVLAIAAAVVLVWFLTTCQGECF